MEFVTLVNRTSKPLQGTWNGRQTVVQPGPNTLPTLVAQAIKNQNPIMGSQGYDIWDVQYLCGIQEFGDDVSPVEQSDSKELINKSLHTLPVVEVPGQAGLYRSAVANELPELADFERP